MRPVDLPDARHMLLGCLHCGNRIEQGMAHSNQAKTNQPDPISQNRTRLLARFFRVDEARPDSSVGQAITIDEGR